MQNAATSMEVHGRTKMLQEINMPPRQLRSPDSASPEITDNDPGPALIEQLTLLGFDVPAFCGTRHDVAGGVPMRISVRELLRSGAGHGGVMNDIQALLEARTPLVLSLTDLGRGDEAIHNLQRLCESLRATVSTHESFGDNLGLCIYSHQVPLESFQVLSRSIPGDGPRYVLLDSLQMMRHCDPLVRAETDSIWSFLWRQRQAAAPMLPAYGAIVRSGCPLLADEVAASVLPVSGVQVPQDSAWLPMRLSLPKFASDAGEIRWERLLPALAGGVELAETLFDRLHWQRAGQGADARLNRRLALSISGLGELVARRGCDPRDFGSLKWLSTVVARIRRTLWHRSGRLAQSSGCLPSICDSDPSRGWPDNMRRDDWRRRWQAALEKSAVRHRNMLVLSPYSVLPAGAACNAAYTDLLPVIACADAWSFAGAPAFADWSLQDFRAFHRRAWAVIQQRKTRA
jgi:hypothetical protein